MKDEKLYTKQELYQKVQLIKDYYEQKLKEKPNAIQIISLSFSCFALGVSIARLFLR